MADPEPFALDPDDAGTRERWEAAAAGVLHKARRLADDAPDHDVWDALSRHTLDGIEVPPLGTPDAVADLPPVGLPGRAPFVRGSVARPAEQGWDVRALFADPATDADVVLADLEGGVSSLWLRLGEGAIAPSSLPSLLEGTMLDLAAVVLDAPDDPLGAAEALATLLADRGVTPAPGTNLGADPVGAAVRHDRPVDADAVRETVLAVARRAQALGTRAVVVDATVVHDRGASAGQEIAWATALGAHYLRLLLDDGLDVADALGLLEFRFAATDEQLTTISALRAARRVWHRVADLAGAPEQARGQHQHAVTSRAATTRHDPYVNLLRGTVAAFSAGVGGAAAVTVLPFDAAIGHPDAFARRIARNTSALLVEESHVAAVTDPAGGAHAVELLTDRLAHAAWDEVGRIEAAGGVLAALADGSLLHRVEATAGARREQVAARTRAITGVSEFPNLHETLPVREPDATGSLGVDRWAQPFEDLRDAPAPTPVLLATMGPVARHTARASFAANLLAAGGVETVTAGATSTVDDVVAAWRDAGSPPVVCLAGPDSAYGEWGADLVAALREAGATWVVVAGPRVEGADDSVALGDDALAFLTRLRSHLGTEEVTA